ncbi:MAG TPA: fused MFS/spermidine synthase [Candidatus Paceibacterota bacterium]|nr:fused MFS/spermidine synthase [Candidatus Paceibacterota bacterium]
MKTIFLRRAICLLFLLPPFLAGAQKVVLFDRISAYHHIQVYDEDGKRTLSFNGSWETTMSLTNPLTGHFEYTEYFQMPWLWNHDIKRVLMVGLGGGSTQRAWQHYYPNVMDDTVEIDPVVEEVAKKYFNVVETPKFKIHINDGRVFLRQTTNIYDVILMDAYSTTRYGSSLPRQLTTKEFFTLASRHLSTNGILAYNVIGQIQGFRATLIGAMYRTLSAVFPQVYMFPAVESQNVVFVATKSAEPFNYTRAAAEAYKLIDAGTVTLPTFSLRVKSFMNQPPPTAATSPLLTDDYAPIESLLQGTQ